VISDPEIWRAAQLLIKRRGSIPRGSTSLNQHSARETSLGPLGSIAVGCIGPMLELLGDFQQLRPDLAVLEHGGKRAAFLDHGFQRLME
jgi:hypothetical protein